ncbi:MAG: hypothetical protein JJU29_21150 [Verrucomicrobia bacterium]|nr:hypothetical protein [Verrucomicrobiota bacterium]
MGDKQPPPASHKFPAHTWQSDDDFNQIPKILHTRGVTLRQEQLQPQGWQLESAQALDLLQKLRDIGTPLGEYVQGRFYRGVLTGLNEAFVIDQATHDQLIQEDPNSADLLKPYLRGRDVKRWSVQPTGEYLIFTRQGTVIEKYPAVKNYLEQYRERLEPKPKDWDNTKPWPGRKAGPYKWYEIQDKIGYWKAIEQPKIMYPDIADGSQFAWDDSGVFPVNTIYMLSTDEKWLVSLLNSKVILKYFQLVCPQIRGGFLRWFTQYVKEIPIPPATEAQKAELSDLSQGCAAATATGDPERLQILEARIDEVVCGVFGLSADEQNAMAQTQTVPKSD